MPGCDPAQLHARLPYSLAMAASAIDHAMPYRLGDVLSRRLRVLLIDGRAAAEAAPEVATLMATLQGRDDAWVRAEVAAFHRHAKEHCLAGMGAPERLAERHDRSAGDGVTGD